MRNSILLLLVLFLITACQGQSPALEDDALRAGFRYSAYGPPYNPGTDYWVSAGEQMASRFDEAAPATIWIVGVIFGEGTTLNFPAPEAVDENIRFSYVDLNEEFLTHYDEIGGKVWLQVEPGNADVTELIHIMLTRYGHHPSVIGVGVDVEWYESTDFPDGSVVTDEISAEWVAAARSYNPDYQVFLKHWLIEKMPPTNRDGLVFIDDSQIFDSLADMVAEFSAWGEHFAPAPVGFQFGYPSDAHWWREYEDPTREVGQAILDAVPNTVGLYWVDFTLLEVFPPAE